MASDYKVIRADNERCYGTDIGRIGPMLLADRYDDRAHELYRVDGSLGTADCVDAAISSALVNLALLVLLLFYVPTVFPAVVKGDLETVVFALPVLGFAWIRVVHIRVSTRILGRLRRNANKAIEDAQADLTGGPFVEQKLRFEHLRNLRWHGLQSGLLRKLLWFFFSSVIVPVLIVWSQSRWSEIVELLHRIGEAVRT